MSTSRHAGKALLPFFLLLIALLLAPAVTAAEPPWKEMATGEPLTEGVLVHDSDNAVIVAFGGRDKHVNKTSDASDALLVLDVAHEDGRWLDVTGEATGLAPGKVFASAGIYWPTRKQVVLYGGNGLSGIVALDMSRGVRGLRWLRPTVPGEAAKRVSHTAVYAPDLDQMLVFGGTRGNTADAAQTLDDVLVIRGSGDGFTARELAVRGERPPARYDHTAVYDGANHRMIVFGGMRTRRTAAYSDVWALDLREPASPVWVRLDGAMTGDVPGARSAHTAAFDARRGQMVVFGGKGRTAKEVWVLHLTEAPDGVRWERTVAGDLATSPGGPSDHGAVWVDAQDCMVVYGGTVRGAEAARAWMYHPADFAGHDWAPAPPPRCDPFDDASACDAKLSAWVFVDMRCDGVYSAGYDAPVVGAVVTVSSPFGSQLVSGVTGANGAVHFQGLDVPAGEPLTLAVEHPRIETVCGYGGRTVTVRAERFGLDNHAVLSIGVSPGAATE